MPLPLIGLILKKKILEKIVKKEVEKGKKKEEEKNG